MDRRPPGFSEVHPKPLSCQAWNKMIGVSNTSSLLIPAPIALVNKKIKKFLIECIVLKQKMKELNGEKVVYLATTYLNGEQKSAAS